MRLSSFKGRNFAIPIPKFSFHFLLVSLLLLLLLPAHLNDKLGHFITIFFFNLVMLASLYVVAEQKKILYIGVLLAIPTMLAGWSDFYTEDRLAYYIKAHTFISFFGFVAFHIFRYLLRQLHPNKEMIIAAISLYLIIGVLWAFIYAALELHYPGTFNLDESITSGSFSLLVNELQYFSFVTLSTLGYGDISPQTSYAQGWVILEAIIGQFYIAIVLARLLGLYVAEESATENAKQSGVKGLLNQASIKSSLQ